MTQKKIYHPPLYAGLMPKSKQFLGGRIQEIDELTLDEAAKMASVHAGTEITPRDFLRAAGHGKILLLAIVRRTARMKRYDSQNEFEVPSGQFVRLPIGACRELAGKDFAKWRTVEDFDHTGQGSLLRCYTKFSLADDEPDFETVTSDCRIWGAYVHALADTLIQAQPQLTAEPRQCSEPAPMVADGASNATVLPFKKAALIAAHIHEWPTITRDIADATANGLATAAKAGARGWWEADALNWARAKGKLIGAEKPADSLAQAMHNMRNLPSQKHTP